MVIKSSFELFQSVKTFDLSTEELVSEWKSDERMSPQGVAVCQGGQSIVTDSTNNCVWVLDEKGWWEEDGEERSGL